jgi:hypothetical protein
VTLAALGPEDRDDVVREVDAGRLGKAEGRMNKDRKRDNDPDHGRIPGGREGARSGRAEVNYLRWRIFDRIRRFFRPTFRRPVPRRLAMARSVRCYERS